jgi:hypothetical protein
VGLCKVEVSFRVHSTGGVWFGLCCGSGGGGCCESGSLLRPARRRVRQRAAGRCSYSGSGKGLFGGSDNGFFAATVLELGGGGVVILCCGSGNSSCCRLGSRDLLRLRPHSGGAGDGEPLFHSLGAVGLVGVDRWGEGYCWRAGHKSADRRVVVCGGWVGLAMD